MASKISINLDTSKESYILAKCKQNDDLVLDANIFENGSKKDLTNCSIVIQARKSDNTYVIQNTDIVKENNKIAANLVRDFTRAAGETILEVVLVESNKQNTTFSFTLKVDGSVIKGAAESKDIITSLEKMQNAVVEIGRISEETQTIIENSGAASKEDFNKVNASLAEIVHQPILVKNTNLQPMVTFVDDDGSIDVLTKLKPIFDSRNVKGVVAAISSLVNGDLKLTTEQLLQLQSEGWEIAGHSVTHSGALDTMSLTEAEYELKECLNTLTSMGLKVSSFIYPWNSSNYSVQRIMKKYYTLAAGQISSYPTNGVPLFTGEITRRNIGSYFDVGLDAAATDGATADTLNYYKWLVDYAVSTNTWLVFVSHCWNTSEAQLKLIGQTIDYIKSLNVPIVTLREGHKTFSNRYEDGVPIDNTLDSNGSYDFNTIAKDGYRYSGKELISYKGDSRILTVNSLAKDYKIGITHTTFGSPSTLPELVAGILITYRTNSDSQCFQLWYPFNSNHIYKRRWNNVANAWTGFEDTTQSVCKLAAINTNYAAQTNIGEEKIIFNTIDTTTAVANAYPENKAGTLITYNLSNTYKQYCRQDYLIYGTNDRYTRHSNDIGVFSVWEKIQKTPTSLQMNLNFGTIAAGATVTQNITITGANIGMITHASPKIAPASGLIWNTCVTALDTVTIRVTNVTSSSIIDTSRNWMVYAFM